MLKRILDVLAASFLLLLLSPLLVLTWCLVRSGLGAPALFIQPRPGLGGRIFNLYKFRTMRDASGPDGLPLPDAERMTRTGAWIRRLSLDELPQLFNVLRGEMSLVGPRPLLARYLDRYTPAQARRHLARPGITGWAQVNGRNALSWEQKFEYDVWYVEHRTFLLDCRILFLTFLKVVRQDGISGEGEATNSEFMGTPAAAAARPGLHPAQPPAQPPRGTQAPAPPA